MMIGAFMLGFVAIVVALGVGLLVWIGIYIRIWWAKRQLTRHGIDPASAGPFVDRSQHRRGNSLEAEYEVISKKQDN